MGSGETFSISAVFLSGFHGMPTYFDTAHDACARWLRGSERAWRVAAGRFGSWQVFFVLRMRASGMDIYSRRLELSAEWRQQADDYWQLPPSAIPPHRRRIVSRAGRLGDYTAQYGQTVN